MNLPSSGTRQAEYFRQSCRRTEIFKELYDQNKPFYINLNPSMFNFPEAVKSFVS